MKHEQTSLPGLLPAPPATHPAAWSNFFHTFRLANSLPPEVLEKLQEERTAIEIGISKITDDDEKRRRQEIERKKWFAKWDDAELERVVKYVLHNPVKAGLCSEWTDWQWSYTKYPM